MNWYVHTQTPEESYGGCLQYTRLTSHFAGGLMSAVMIVSKEEYGQTWHWIFILRPGVIKQNKAQKKAPKKAQTQTLSKWIYLTKENYICFRRSAPTRWRRCTSRRLWHLPVASCISSCATGYGVNPMVRQAQYHVVTQIWKLCVFLCSVNLIYCMPLY